MSENNKNRYSDEELAEFRVLIEEKLSEARKQLEQSQEQLTELNESGETSRAGTFEEGASNWQREHLSKMASRQQRFVRDLEHALIRIKNKTYGVCSVTGELIEKKRLFLVPHATKSIKGKELLEQQESQGKRPLQPSRNLKGKPSSAQILSRKAAEPSKLIDSLLDEDEDELLDEDFQELS